MKRPEVLPEEVEERFRELSGIAERGGYHLNPDESLARHLVEGLVVNEKRYGFPSCPCRLCMGSREKNLDIICPCDYRDEDLVKYGACYCGLYVSWRVAEGDDEAKLVPDRRLVGNDIAGYAAERAGIPIGAAVASVPDDLYEDSAAFCGVSNPGSSEDAAVANPGSSAVTAPAADPDIIDEPDLVPDPSLAAAEPRRNGLKCVDLKYPVLRCRVCGYLCARVRAPGMCPICGAYSDRFERFL